MPDAYLAISEIANDVHMNERVRSCATQQEHLSSVNLDGDPLAWTNDNRYLWASSPTWGEKWDYALAAHPPDPEAPPYFPGRDPAVITDGDILATVQALAPTR